MNLSRLATLAVFFMMVLSAFVTVPTYNVGADEGGCMDYDDENGNGAYDEGEPCHDDDDGDDNPPGEGEGCMDYDDENGNGAYDEGEPCYDDECPFDPDNSDSPCNAEECHDNHDSQECQDIIDNYCSIYDDPGCGGDCPFDDREGSPCENVDTNPCRDDHDSPDCHEYAESYCVNNDDPGCYALMADYVCYNEDIHDVEWDYGTEDECLGAGYMWVSSDGGPDNGDNDIFGNLDFKIKMHSLSEWHVSGTGQSRIEDANSIRDGISEMCQTMGIEQSEFGIIDEECFDHWVMMIESDGYGNDGYDEFRCPPDLSEDECKEFEACQNTMSMTCMRLFYDYCKDNPMCDDEDEECYDDEGNLEPCGPNIWHVLFAYEDGDMTAEEFLESDAMDEWFDDMDMDDDIPTPEEAMDETDANGDGFMSFDEFEAAWNENEDEDDEDLDWEAVEDLFNAVDTDGDGLLELDDLQLFIDGIVEMTDDDHDYDEHYCSDDDGNEMPAHGDNEDRCHPYEHPGIYSMNTFTVEQDSTVKISSGFETHESPDFVCGDGSTTISFQYVNDDNGDCDDGADEQWYDSNTPDDMTDDCQEWNSDDCVGEEVNWFDCHDGSEIWINQVNNWEWDCDDGEDEYQEEFHSWYGHIYLLEGDHELIDGSDLTSDEVYATESSHCDWGDDEKTYIECDNFIDADLVANTDYTLVTMGECMHESADYMSWGELDCENYGKYNHQVLAEDGTESHIEGEILNAPRGYYIYEIIDGEYVYHQDSAANFTVDEDGGSNFVLYNKETFVVDEEGFSGTLVSFAYNCWDYNDNGDYDYCGAETPYLYLYDAFDEAAPESGLIGSAVHLHGDDGWDCREYLEDYNLDDMHCSISEMDLDLSEGDYTIVTAFHNDAMFTNMIFSEGGTAKEWGSYLHNAYYDYDDDGGETLVTGNDRINMPYPEYHEWEPECYDDDGNEVDCEDMFGPMYIIFEIMENMTGYDDGTIEAEDAANNMKDLMYKLFDIMSMFEDDHNDDHDDNHEDDFNCHKNWVDNGKPVWSQGWPNYDKQMTVEWPAGSGDLWYPEGGAISVNEEPGLGHWWVCDYDYEGDDNHPPLLDGIAGVQDSEDSDCKPESTNVVGSIVENYGLAMFCSFEFKVTFEGADDTLDMHHLHIPFSSYEHWTVEFVLLDGYEILECKLDDIGELCEEMADGRFSGKGPAGVSMIKTVEEEPQPDCDHFIGLDNTGMAFDPIELKINAGETVCWQWEDAEMEHNVLELEAEYDSSMNLADVNFGFSSGKPSATVDFRHTFKEDDMTHYYVCEPHASTGMVGKIVVGTPEDTAVDEAIEEGLPSVSFIVGSLVLVGAAGLRRRIH